MKNYITLPLILVLIAVCAIRLHAQKYVGGDISMLKKFVDEGAIYYDNNGVATAPLTIFKNAGWNSMRVRLFVDPTKASLDDRKQGAIQDFDYVIALGKEIKAAGFSFMLDFHYSDTWTDPGKHATPDVWTGMSVEQLKAQVYEYTKDCLEQLNAAQATPDFIQVGNEITTGMLWQTGRIYAGGGAPTGGSWDSFAGYLASSIKACNELCPDAKIVIHTELHAPADVPKFYNNLAAYSGVSYDIVGLSYYPDFHGDLSVLEDVINTLETQNSTKNKQIMIVETGYGFKWQLGGAKYDFTSTWTLTEAGQKAFAHDLIEMLNSHANVNGLYWWYPEYNLNNIVFPDGDDRETTPPADWNKDFTAGYWNGALFHYCTGKALAALYELENFASASGIKTIGQLDNLQLDNSVYDLQGRKVNVNVNVKKGVYIVNGKKVIIK